jgi:hypothetical protein
MYSTESTRKMCSQDHTVRQVRLRAEVEKRRSLVLSTVICNGLWIGRSKKITEMHTHTHTHKSVFQVARQEPNQHPTASFVQPYMYVHLRHARTDSTADGMRGFTSKNLLFTCVPWRSDGTQKETLPSEKEKSRHLRNQETECNHHITHETQRSAACSGPQRAYVCLPSTLVKGGGIAMSFSTLSCSAHTT